MSEIVLEEELVIEIGNEIPDSCSSIKDTEIRSTKMRFSLKGYSSFVMVNLADFLK